MDFEKLLNSITPDIYKNLKQSVELGKWPNGQALTKEQTALCLQAMIRYEEKHLPEEQRTGYVEPKKPTACGDHSHDDLDEEKAIKWDL
ncbi:MAG: YeaC family protein [Cellvibrionaceae bacterium]